MKKYRNYQGSPATPVVPAISVAPKCLPRRLRGRPVAHAVPAALLISLAVFAFTLTGCVQTDVVAKFANTSFKAIIDASKTNASFIEEDNVWALASGAGDSILFSTDFSRNAAGAGGKGDVEFIFDAAPFTDAGLDVARLPGAEGIEYELNNGAFLIRFELGNDAFPAAAAGSFKAVFAEIVKTQRPRIGYHEELDHYGISLGNGNMFEWAKDLGINDKDIVWVLNPEPFIQAGADPSKISGWIFAKIEMKDDVGKKILVDKLLKPFNLD